MPKKTRPFMPPDPTGEFRYRVPIYLLNMLVAVGRVRDAELEKVLRPFDLTLMRFRSLAVIWRLGSCTMSELAIMSASDRTTLTRTVDQLTDAGMVDRAHIEGDRRKVKLSLTPAGLAALRQAEQAVRLCNDRCLADVSEDVQRAMVRGFETMLNNFGGTAEQMEKILDPREMERD